ncbi:hypothetical protein U1Q18_037493, partial [Sarracenia purpurea var. burkii]
MGGLLLVRVPPGLVCVWWVGWGGWWGGLVWAEVGCWCCRFGWVVLVGLVGLLVLLAWLGCWCCWLGWAVPVSWLGELLLVGVQHALGVVFLVWGA